MCNRRIDYVMHILITKVAPDFAEKLKWMITMRGTSSTYQGKVSIDHKKTEYLLTVPTKITEGSDGDHRGRKWTVPSATGIGHYEVKRLTDGCGDQCHIKCQFCHVCPHEYSCSCIRFSNSGRMPCKHIHTVHVLFNGSDEAEQSDAEGEEVEPIIANQPEIFDVDEELPNDASILQATVQQLEVHSSSIASHVQMLKTLAVECDSLELLKKASAAAEEALGGQYLVAAIQFEELLIKSIAHLRIADSSMPLPIGNKTQKHRISPQKATSNVLPLAKKPKASRALSSPEKEANATVQGRLNELSRIVFPFCSVCDYQFDLRNKTAQKCPLCECWRHDSCFHVCVM